MKLKSVRFGVAARVGNATITNAISKDYDMALS